MASNTKLTPHDFSVHIGRQLLESISETANTAYYVFLGAHLPSSTANVDLLDTVETTYKEAYQNMIQGKRVAQGDANLMIRNIPYESRVFDMYDDSLDLSTQDFYAVVNAESFYHVFKCLDNNNGTNSTAEPDFSQITGANTQLYQTADGYRWKYMYSVSDQVKSKFATSEFFPLVPNTTVSSSAVEGVLDIVKVEGTGRGYHNYLTGTFATQDLKINGNTILYGLSSPLASTVNGYYTGCLIYISSGTGVGSYARIVDYFSNLNGNFIQINTPFEVPPINGSGYQIYPEVLVLGSGAETENVVARALINSLASNSVYRIEVLNHGANYDYFQANVVANAVVGVEKVAELRPIYAPYGGHGSDAAFELLATQACFSVKFANSETDTILTSNDFRQIGILKDPLFANVNLKLDSPTGTFLFGEHVLKLTPVRLDTGATLSTTSHTVSCATADFTGQVSPGDYLYLVSSDGLDVQLAEVDSVTNTTYLNLSTNGSFACTDTTIYAANVSSSGYVLTLESSANLFLSNVSGVFGDGDLIVGHSSGAKATVSSVVRNGVTKGFNTFIQLYKYAGTADAGSFQEDETVYQSSLSVANASLHSSVVDGQNVTLYVSNQIGTFHVQGGKTIVGKTSGAISTPDVRYSPELVFGSGRVIYMENIEPVTRQDTQSETLKLIFEF